jgi:hippurate hydrolase
MPALGPEDFVHLLDKIPGCYLFIGYGTGKGGCMIHNARYDFSDDILTLGASYRVQLAHACLAG